MKKSRIYLLAATAVLIILLCIIFLRPFSGENKSSFNELKKSSEKEPAEYRSDLIPGPIRECESNPNPLFTAAFTDNSKIETYAPIGGLGGGSPGRSYIGIKEGMETPIYNPTDAVLETIIYARRGGPDTLGEYGLFFRVSCEVTYLFDHIDRVPDKIRDLAPKEPADTTQTEKGTKPNILIKKGELLGYSDGTPLAHTFDFLLVNKAKPAPYINTERWTWEQAIYPDCPYDYFIPELKTIYYEKLGMPTDQGLKKSDDCGSPSHDAVETISGGWFKGDSTDIEGDYLAIAKDFDTVQVFIRKDGNIIFSLTDYEPSKYPVDIVSGKSVCYFDGNSNNWAYIKLISETGLSLAKGTGNCPAGFPEADADLWVR